MDARAAGIYEADHRRAAVRRQVHRLAYLLPHDFGQRAAKHGEVLGVGECEPAVNFAVAGDHGVAEVALGIKPEIGAAVLGEWIQFGK